MPKFTFIFDAKKRKEKKKTNQRRTKLIMSRQMVTFDGEQLIHTHKLNEDKIIKFFFSDFIDVFQLINKKKKYEKTSLTVSIRND